MWTVYIINKQGQLYAGITTDLANRLSQHRVKTILYKQEFLDKKEAAKREREIKGWSREKKRALIEKHKCHEKHKCQTLRCEKETLWTGFYLTV